MKNIKILKRSIDSIPKTHVNKTVFKYYVDDSLVDSTLETSAFLLVLNNVLVPDSENYEIQGNWIQSPTILVSGERLPDVIVNTYTGIKYIFKLANTVIRFPAVPAYLDPNYNFSQGTFYESENPTTGEFTYTASNDLNLITHVYDEYGDPNQYISLTRIGLSSPAEAAIFYDYDEYWPIQGAEIGTHGFTDSSAIQPLSFWNISTPGAMGPQVFGSTFTERNTGFSVSTSDISLKLTSIGEIEATYKPNELIAKILLIADRFKARLEKPAEINV